MLPIVLVVIGLFHVTIGAISPFCGNSTSSAIKDNDYFQLKVIIPQVGTYDLKTFGKNTPYSGKLFVVYQLHSSKWCDCISWTVL